MIWLPMRMTGLSEVMGSWNTMAIRAPQHGPQGLGRGPHELPALEADRAGPLYAGPPRMPMTLRDRTVLPDPDSPTTPRVRPRARVNETSSTARSRPAEVRKVGGQPRDLEEGHVVVGGVPAGGVVGGHGPAHSLISVMS